MIISCDDAVVQLLSHVQFLCNPMDCTLPGSSVYGISQTRTLGWVAIPFSRGSSRLEIKPESSALAGRFFSMAPPGKPCDDASSGFKDVCYMTHYLSVYLEYFYD